MGNSRLVGGPEDGVEVDVGFPPAPELRRSVGGTVHAYRNTGETASDGRMLWEHTGADEPGDAPEDEDGDGEE
jgi:hypothetical protein